MTNCGISLIRCKGNNFMIIRRKHAENSDNKHQCVIVLFNNNKVK